MHIQLKLDELRGPPNPVWLHCPKPHGTFSRRVLQASLPLQPSLTFQPAYCQRTNVSLGKADLQRPRQHLTTSTSKAQMDSRQQQHQAATTLGYTWTEPLTSHVSQGSPHTRKHAHIIRRNSPGPTAPMSNPAAAVQGVRSAGRHSSTPHTNTYSTTAAVAAAAETTSHPAQHGCVTKQHQPCHR
jgi:hypothetical protein